MGTLRSSPRPFAKYFEGVALWHSLPTTLGWRLSGVSEDTSIEVDWLFGAQPKNLISNDIVAPVCAVQVTHPSHIVNLPEMSLRLDDIGFSFSCMCGWWLAGVPLLGGGEDRNDQQRISSKIQKGCDSLQIM